MRARNIKPGFFDNETLAEGGPCAQILFEGLWCLADRDGVLENRPQRIKANIFPYYEPNKFGGKDVNQLLKFLCEKSFITFYEKDGFSLIHIINFKTHQSPHHTERKGKLPAPPDYGDITVNSPLENGKNPPDSLIPDSLIPDSLIPDSLIPDEKQIAKHVSGGNGSAPQAPVFSCEHFDINQEFADSLRADYPALTDSRFLKELKKSADWLSDNAKDRKRKANGHIKNPRLFLRNWFEKVIIPPGEYKPPARAQPYSPPPDLDFTPVYPQKGCPTCKGRGAYEKDGVVIPCECLAPKGENSVQDISLAGIGRLDGGAGPTGSRTTGPPDRSGPGGRGRA